MKAIAESFYGHTVSICQQAVQCGSFLTLPIMCRIMIKPCLADAFHNPGSSLSTITSTASLKAIKKDVLAVKAKHQSSIEVVVACPWLGIRRCRCR
jgi:hypothetical protein